MRAPESGGELAEELYSIFHFMLTRLPSQLSKKQLSESEFFTLLILIKGEEERRKTTPKKIAKITLYPSSIVTRILDKLEEKGFIKRIPYFFPADKRKVKVEVTPAGMEAFSEEKNERKKWLEKILSVLSEGERRSFVTSFQKILRGMVTPTISDNL